ASTAFRKYLGNGKAGDVKDHWAPLDEVIGWIRGAGGIAVLAHPGHYQLTRSKRRRLVAAFKAAGGGAIEVISGRQDPALTAALARDSVDFELLASAGSDFHRPGQFGVELGAVASLPPICEPVWGAA
ncbi:MAG: phosphatase, partial [Gammaproteobacteria bacterium]|nr:phosphatase [Gammaproteobacteria bacterium]